ncbi:beta-lactamase/transpeptidase-like protein [Trametes gibbosa]|nr:beta-lactamase/transpeptidase-like protein [Trametes gibbosa]
MGLGFTVSVAFASLLIGSYYSGHLRLPLTTSTERGNSGVSNPSKRWDCRPFLPNLFADTAPLSTHPSIHDGVTAVDRYLASRFSVGDIDSLSFAIVTKDGPVYERNFGVMRGNETGSPATTSHSTYRIASTAKLFPILEGLILEHKGIISWDDPVSKYLEGFDYRLDGLDPQVTSEHGSDKPPITLFQLATHMSGLGRDWPPGTVSNWPHDMYGMGPPPTNGRPFPTKEDLLDAIARHHLTSPPLYHPAYSNTGIAAFGLALAAASSAEAGNESVISYADLLKRDVFAPMGLNGSHFLATDTNKHYVVVPSLAPEVADQDFLDAMNPAAGQFSSLSDLITVTQTILDPRHPKSQISRYSRDKWLLPVHSFEEDDWTELGLMWEIIKAEDSNGRMRKIYWKLGAMAGYHTALAIHPGTSYGIIVLMAGRYPDAAKLAYDAFELMQPAIDRALADMATDLYAGEWRADHGNSSARVVVEQGTLYVERYVLLDVDALSKFGAQGRLALRPSGRRDEFRLDTGIPGYNGLKHMGCYPYWNGQDLWGVRNNAVINALYYSGEGEARRLHVPSLALTMRKV